MEIIRNPDGSLIVPVPEARHHGDEITEVGSNAEAGTDASAAATRVLHPGEGGYNEALAEWDLQQNPDHASAVSTASGREQAMTVVHTLSLETDRDVPGALAGIDDPGAVGEALRHVLVGGTHSVEDFSSEVAGSKGGEPLAVHLVTKIIGEVLAVVDS